MRRLLTLVILALLIAISNAEMTGAQPGRPGRPGGETPPIGGEPIVAPPTVMETATTVTFYENADFTGASHMAEIKPTSGVEATRVIPTQDLVAAGLFGRVSSVRLACGSRPSRVALFDIDWGESTDGTVLNCAPNQTVTLDLAAQPVAAFASPRDLNDKVNAAALVAHVRSSDDQVHSKEFAFILGQVWKTRMASLDNATSQWTRIWLEDFHNVRIRQALTVNHWACTARDAIFDLRLNMTAANFQPVFRVDVLSELVAHGFGDGWPTRCRANYLASLHSNLLAAKKEIEAQLPQELFKNISSSTYYFAPELGTRGFQVFHWQ